MISSFPDTNPTPDIIGKSDFSFFYDGFLQKGDDARIPVVVKAIDVNITKLECYLQEASTGQDVIVEFWLNGVSVGTVTIAAGATYGYTIIGRTLVPAGTIGRMKINQVGSLLRGKSLTGYMRVTS